MAMDRESLNPSSMPAFFEYTSIMTMKTKRVSQEEVGYGTCRKVNEFEKLNRIGEGTYGIVYRARDTKNNEIVALKRVRIQEKTTEMCGISEAALREITLLKKVRHKNLVLLKEIAVTKEIKGIFLVMEYCEQDLASLLDNLKIPFTKAETKCLMKQLFEGLEYLHENYIIHRDLKVSNLLITKDGILKIADFGLARTFGYENLTMTPRVVTLWYRPPELLLGARFQTPAVDTWATGCVLGELLLHRPLLPGKTEIEQIDKIVQLLGTPTEAIWPGFNQLPLLANMALRDQPFNHIKSVFESETLATLTLLNELFTYDPKRRCSATRALRHAYFEEMPLACDPSLLPFYAQHQHHRDSARKRRRSSSIVID